MSSPASDRERLLTQAFVALADSLVADFDVVDLLDRLTRYCVQLLDTAAAGLLLADQHGNLRMIAASSEGTRLLELFQLQNEEGPCADCYRQGASVAVEDVRKMHAQWPRFGPLAEASGYLSVHALPMRLRDDVIGTLNVFQEQPGLLEEADVLLGQALADVATISILQSRSIAHREALAEQLQTALHSRIVIEQAKGVLAERASVDVDDAFLRLRGHARSSNRRLSDVANQVVRGEVDPQLLLGAPEGKRSSGH